LLVTLSSWRRQARQLALRAAVVADASGAATDRRVCGNDLPSPRLRHIQLLLRNNDTYIHRILNPDQARHALNMLGSAAAASCGAASCGAARQSSAGHGVPREKHSRVAAPRRKISRDLEDHRPKLGRVVLALCMSTNLGLSLVHLAEPDLARPSCRA